MKTNHDSPCRSPNAPRHLAALAAIGMFALMANTQGVEPPYQILAPTEGGLSPTPDIISQDVSNGQISLEWNGFAGPYSVEGLPAVGQGPWITLGTTNGKSLRFDPGNMTLFRVKGANPEFGSADTCAECHPETHQNWTQTIHANALTTLKNIGQSGNAACLKCHTVGFGLPSGFSTEAATPYYAGVQCENCHGPAGLHAANPDNLSLRPVITDSAKLCGGCHNGFHHPTYDEWNTAGHSHVVEHVAEYFRDPVNGEARMKSCGACHSGAVRLAMIRTTKGWPLELPDGETAATTAITCQVCHDPHKPNLDDTHSLRNTRHSTAFFSYSTSSSTDFKSQWDAGGKDIQICGQCHNSRGASPDDTSRPPHHSTQYNIVSGDVGVAAGYVPAAAPGQQSAHRNIQNQCTRCHTHRHEPDVASEENPVYTGHGFEPTIDSCVECHQTEANAESLLTSTQSSTKQMIQEVKALLDTWATTKAPEALRTQYGALAWEYNNVGQLSNPNGASIKGPTSSEQSDIPQNIRKARYYLYMVEHDGSYGVHNKKYTQFLLDTAKANVQAQIDAP